jgi:TonB family protein
LSTSGRCALALAFAGLVPVVPARALEPIRRHEVGVDAQFFEKNKTAVLEHWVAPVRPEALKGERPAYPVRVRYVIDKQGNIRDPEMVSGDERFQEAALVAIRQWHYRPAVVEGKPKAVTLEVTFDFRTLLPRETKAMMPPFSFGEPPLRPPEEIRADDPIYPKHLVKRQLFGEVELNLGVDEQGRVAGVEVLRATHTDFVGAALAAVEGWALRPALRGRLPEKGEKRALLSFTVMDTETEHVARDEWLARNGITLRDPAAQQQALFFDETPQAVAFADPVYPDALRREGVSGSAKVNFAVDAQGQVAEVAVVEATREEFGAALAAAVASWQFKPLAHGGEFARHDFSAQWRFEQPTSGNTSPECLQALEADAAQVAPGKLDHRPELLYQRQPISPAGVPATGRVEIEAVISRTGRVCWPKVLQATDPALGWAAATAVNQWYFTPPRLQGQPVAVRVVIPIEFRPAPSADTQ